MKRDGILLAWIEENDKASFKANIIGTTLKESCLPFTFLCASRLQAQLWVESQAEALKLQVDWISGPH